MGEQQRTPKGDHTERFLTRGAWVTGGDTMAALDAEAIEHAFLDALSAGEDAEVRRISPHLLRVR